MDRKLLGFWSKEAQDNISKELEKSRPTIMYHPVHTNSIVVFKSNGGIITDCNWSRFEKNGDFIEIYPREGDAPIAVFKWTDDILGVGYISDFDTSIM